MFCPIVFCERQDGFMLVLTQYLDTNREKAYSFATSNTNYDEEHRPVVLEDDEWRNESEWDDLFESLKNKDR